MPFESSNIVVVGQLRNPDGSSRVGSSARVEIVLAEPDAPTQVLGEALSQADGTFQIQLGVGSPIAPSEHVVLLRLVVDELLVAESWQSLAAEGDLVTFDFGLLTVQEVAAYSVGPRAFHGVPDGMELGGGAGAPEGGAAEGTVPQSEYDAVAADLASTQTELADTQAELTTAQNELATAQADLSTAQADLATAQTDLSTAQADLATAQTDLATAQAEVASLQEQLAGSSSLGAVVENVGTQLKATQESLRSSGASVQLGKISMDLKVMPSGDGTSFSFVPPDQQAGLDGAVLSTVHLDFVTQDPPSTTPATVIVPDLGGLTETAVRRVANSLGLGVKVLLQAVADDGPVEQAGRAMRQIPAAGAEVDPGTVLTVLFGKALDA